MPDKRSIDMAEAGRKASKVKTAQFGPGELKRTGDQAAWTKSNPDQIPGANPYRREKVYSQAELERAQKFNEWRKVNPNASHDENPYSWTRASA